MDGTGDILPLPPTGRRRQLPRQPEPRADDLDAARVRHHALPAEQARVPAHRGGARPAPQAIEDSIEPAEQAKREADELLEEYRARLREAREQADDIVVRARKAAERQRRDEGRGQQAARGAARADAARHRGRDAPRARARSAGRSPTSPCIATEKVTRKSLTPDDHRRLIEEALARSTSRAGRRTEGAATRHGRDRRGLRARAVRGGQGRRRPRPRARRAGPVRRHARRGPQPAGLLVLALLLERGEEARACGAS